MTPEFEMYARSGQMRFPFFARDDHDAAGIAIAYAARNGVKVSVLDMARERPCGRYVGTFAPTWVADTVLHLAFGVAAPDAPAEAN